MDRKVRIHWQSDGDLIQKVWRYNAETIHLYSRQRVETELIELFPSIEAKGFRLELSYEDSLVGKITIDGDRDMQAALKAFSEEESLEFRTLVVTECIKPEIEIQKEKECTTCKETKGYLYKLLDFIIFFIVPM